MQALWKEISDICMQTMQSSMNLVYADVKEIVTSLVESMPKIEKDEKLG